MICAPYEKIKQADGTVMFDDYNALTREDKKLVVDYLKAERMDVFMAIRAEAATRLLKKREAEAQVQQLESAAASSLARVDMYTQQIQACDDKITALDKELDKRVTKEIAKFSEESVSQAPKEIAKFSEESVSQAPNKKSGCTIM